MCLIVSRFSFVQFAHLYLCALMIHSTIPGMADIYFPRTPVAPQGQLDPSPQTLQNVAKLYCLLGTIFG